MKFASSNRVKAPNLNSASGDRLYDSAALKLPGWIRGVVDDNLVSGEFTKKQEYAPIWGCALYLKPFFYPVTGIVF